MALTALASRGLERNGARDGGCSGFGIFGAAMFYGDGMITPAIYGALARSRGSRCATPLLAHCVVPLTAIDSDRSCS